MKYYIILTFAFFISCINNPTNDEIKLNFEKGNFKIAKKMIDEYSFNPDIDSTLFKEYIYLSEIMSRVKIDFSKDKKDVIKHISQYYNIVSDSMINDWEERGKLEYKIIDGDKKYFNRAATNLFLIDDEAKKQKEKIIGKSTGGVTKFKQHYVSKLLSEDIDKKTSIDKRTIKINYSISLDANAIPEGEIVKCWIPYPRINDMRLSNIELISASEDNYIIAPKEQIQRSIYIEKRAVRDSATIFNIVYSADFAGVWFDIKPEDILEYNKTSALYKNYTSEIAPHIKFSDRIKSLAREIVGNEENPVKQVELIYYWMNDNITWSGALEYSIMPNIPKYVLDNMRGDCGMQTLLFMSLARSLGIPTKWQSGWYLLPEEINLHDWAEVYYEGVGWVPVDPSFKLTDSKDKKVKDFYINGMDSYRLIINDGYSQEFHPKKEFFRSEPIDFQRGELEWRGGNLYFDKWSYYMDITYID
ncbi:MAG: transglutaminase-like domain-containing protein [Bacteroidota bacterium]